MRASTRSHRPRSTQWFSEGRACLVLSIFAVLTAPAASHAQASPEQQTESRERFQRGRAFYDAHRWSDAIDEFRESLALSSSPNTRLLIARALREQGGHTAEAFREFQAAASEAEVRAPAEPRYAPIAGVARSEAQALVPLISQLRIQMVDPPADTTVRLDGAVVPRNDWNADFAIEPGRHTVEAAAAGRQPFEHVWTVEAGHLAQVPVTLGPELSTETGHVELPTSAPATPGPATPVELPAPPVAAPPAIPYQAPPSSGLRAGGGVALGIGLAAILGGAIAGTVAWTTYDGLQRDCGGARCPSTVSDAQARVELGRTSGTLFTAGMISGGVLVITGAVMLASSRAAERRVPEALGRIWLDPASGAAGLRGMF